MRHPTFVPGMMACIPRLAALWGLAFALAGTLGGPLAAAPACKYKTDGAGNCLSPAFYKCQRDWTACSKKCPKKNAAKCQDACEVKYAGQCGD